MQGFQERNHNEGCWKKLSCHSFMVVQLKGCCKGRYVGSFKMLPVFGTSIPYNRVVVCFLKYIPICTLISSTPILIDFAYMEWGGNDIAYYILIHVLCTWLLSIRHRCQHATLQKGLTTNGCNSPRTKRRAFMQLYLATWFGPFVQLFFLVNLVWRVGQQRRV